MTIFIPLISVLMFLAAADLILDVLGGLIFMSKAEGFKEFFTFLIKVVSHILAVAALIYVGLLGFS